MESCRIASTNRATAHQWRWRRKPERATCAQPARSHAHRCDASQPSKLLEPVWRSASSRDLRDGSAGAGGGGGARVEATRSRRTRERTTRRSARSATAAAATAATLVAFFQWQHAARWRSLRRAAVTGPNSAGRASRRTPHAARRGAAPDIRRGAWCRRGLSAPSGGSAATPSSSRLHRLHRDDARGVKTSNGPPGRPRSPSSPRSPSAPRSSSRHELRRVLDRARRGGAALDARQRQLHHLGRGRRRMAHALLSGGAADEDDGRFRAAADPVQARARRRARHGRGGRGGDRRARRAARRADGLPRRGAAAAARGRPHRLHDVRRPRPDVRLRARRPLFMKAASASRPLDHVYVAGSVDAAAFYTKAAEGGAPVRARATRAAITSAILGGAARKFSLVLTARHSPAARAGTSCASRSPMRPTT